MDKQRMFRILSKADRSAVREMADKIRRDHQITVIKEPEKALAMIKMREPVKSSLFYLGEVIITEAAVQTDGVNGMAVQMGSDPEKTLDMAIIDAACNKGIFDEYDRLISLESEQIQAQEKENAMFMKTKVDFSTMNTEAQS